MKWSSRTTEPIIPPIMQQRLNYTVRELNQIIPEGYLTFILVIGNSDDEQSRYTFYDSVLSIHVLAMELCSFYVKNPFFILPIAAETVKRNITWTQESPLSGEQRAGLGASSSLACGLLSDFGHITSRLMPQFSQLSNVLRSPDEDLEISM